MPAKSWAKACDWLSRIDKDAKEERNRKIFDMWMACYTQQEIADTLGCLRPEVDHFLRNLAKNPFRAKSARLLANYDDPDFEPILYDQFRMQKKSDGLTHFGNSEVTCPLTNGAWPSRSFWK